MVAVGDADDRTAARRDRSRVSPAGPRASRVPVCTRSHVNHVLGVSARSLVTSARHRQLTRELRRDRSGFRTRAGQRWGSRGPASSSVVPCAEAYTVPFWSGVGTTVCYTSVCYSTVCYSTVYCLSLVRVCVGSEACQHHGRRSRSLACRHTQMHWRVR
jgi:hypothetical protein